MAYFQSFTNTYAPVDWLKALFDEALAVENVVGLAIGTRPDCVDASVLDLIETYTRQHLIWIEYGLQSVTWLPARGAEPGAYTVTVSVGEASAEANEATDLSTPIR